MPTHYMDKEGQVVGHNNVESDNEFHQPIYEEVQAGSKRKHSDCDSDNYVTLSEVEELDDEYFDVEDHNLNFRMWPAKELHVMTVCFFIYLNCTLILLESQTDNGVDKLKEAKVDRDVDQESGQRSTTVGQVSLMRTMCKASKHPHYQNQDLPSVLMVGKTWAKDIIPALLVWAGSLADPWTISDDELMRSLQIIIPTIALDFKDLNDIHPGMAIFNIVLLVLFTLLLDSCFVGQACQQLCQWCRNFGSTAIALVTHFLVSDPEIGMPSLAQAQELCSDLLENIRFLYLDQDSGKPENLFQSYFVLYLLGHAHLCPCADSPDVPDLKIGELKKSGVKGVLALTCAAVCIAF